jgi:hypothetical protein
MIARKYIGAAVGLVMAAAFALAAEAPAQAKEGTWSDTFAGKDARREGMRFSAVCRLRRANFFHLGAGSPSSGRESLHPERAQGADGPSGVSSRTGEDPGNTPGSQPTVRPVRFFRDCFRTPLISPISRTAHLKTWDGMARQRVDCHRYCQFTSNGASFHA